MDAMEFAASAALLLDRLAGVAGTATSPCAVPRTRTAPPRELRVTELRDQMRDHALALAARLDARNGTTAQSTRSATALPPNRSWRNSR